MSFSDPRAGVQAARVHLLNLAEPAEAPGHRMEAVGLERVALLGNSLGCWIIAEFAPRHLDRIDLAVLTATLE